VCGERYPWAVYGALVLRIYYCKLN
jgi:hypothetical protein